MQKLPHYYHASASGLPTGVVATDSGGLSTLEIAAPKEFDGPGDKWSPEELLVGCVANCFILTFRAVASASKLDWTELSCEASGTLELVERKAQFTEFSINASLKIGAEQDKENALQLLEKAERNCLITNSLTAKVHLNSDVIISS